MADRKRDDHVGPTKKDGPRDDVAEHLRAILWKDGERDDEDRRPIEVWDGPPGRRAHPRAHDGGRRVR